MQGAKKLNYVYDFENSKWKENYIDIIRPMFAGCMLPFCI